MTHVSSNFHEGLLVKLPNFLVSWGVLLAIKEDSNFMEGENQSSLPFKVIKKWKSDFYSMPNVFLNGYCKEVGWQGHIVYSALWRHADAGTCYPSLKHMADELGVSVSAIRRGIESLKKLNIIVVQMRTRTRQGRGSNIYYLLDKTEWKPAFRHSNKKKGGSVQGEH